MVSKSEAGDPQKGNQAVEGRESSEYGEAEHTVTTQSQAQFNHTHNQSEDEISAQWIQFIAILFAAAGAGVGLFMMLLDAINEPVFQANVAAGAGEFIELEAAMGELLVFPLFVVGLFLAPFLGVVVATNLDPQSNDVYKIAGAGVGAGIIIAIFLASLLSAATFQTLSLNFGGVLFNGIAAAVIAALLAGAGVWATTNRYPGLS